MGTKANFHWLEGDAVWVLVFESAEDERRYLAAMRAHELSSTSFSLLNAAAIAALQRNGAVSFRNTSDCPAALDLLNKASIPIPQTGQVPVGWPESTAQLTSSIVWDKEGVVWMFTDPSDQQLLTYHQEVMEYMRTGEYELLRQEVKLSTMKLWGAVYYRDWRDSPEATVARTMSEDSHQN
jgi:hypothetical protein